mgnify:FL=1
MGVRKELNISIGNRIRISRENAGLTQEELAEKLNLSAQFISTIERGVAVAALATIIRLCEVLNVSAEWLLRGLEATPSTDRIAAKMESLSKTQLAVVDKLTDDLLQLLEVTRKEAEADF